MENKETEYDAEWEALLEKLEITLGKKPNLEALLFLIGMQELGKGTRVFSKEEKQDLMHIAVCRLLSLEGYYEFEGTDKDGWPHWRIVKTLPTDTEGLKNQEQLLIKNIKKYFADTFK